MLKLSIMWALHIVSAFPKNAQRKTTIQVIPRVATPTGNGTDGAASHQCGPLFIFYSFEGAGSEHAHSWYHMLLELLLLLLLVPCCAHFKKHCVGFWRLFPMSNFYDSFAVNFRPGSAWSQKKRTRQKGIQRKRKGCWLEKAEGKYEKYHWSSLVHTAWNNILFPAISLAPLRFAPVRFGLVQFGSIQSEFSQLSEFAFLFSHTTSCCA